MAPDVNARVATALRVELARRALPDCALAEILGVSRQAISMRMRGKQAFRVSELGAIAAAWGIDLAELIGERQPATSAA